MTESSPERPVPEPCEPLLGCASTRSLIAELHARAEVADTAGETWPAYRSVDEPPSPAVSLAHVAAPFASADRSVRAAKAVVDFLDDPEVPRNRYCDGQAAGAVRVWAEMLGMPNDFTRAIGLARVHVMDAEVGASQ